MARARWPGICGVRATQSVARALVHFQTDGEMAPNPTLLSDDRLATDGIWASSRQHPVQHRHADGRLGLLSRKTAGAQTRSDQRFVAAHCRFYYSRPHVSWDIRSYISG